MGWPSFMQYVSMANPASRGTIPVEANCLAHSSHTGEAAVTTQAAHHRLGVSYTGSCGLLGGPSAFWTPRRAQHDNGEWEDGDKFVGKTVPGSTSEEMADSMQA